MRKQTATRPSVFKGREAKLNRAMFQTLALKGPQTIYDIHKQIKAFRGFKTTQYSSINKRTRVLELNGYLRNADTKKTRAGFKAIVYEVTARACPVILLNDLNLEDLIIKTDETNAAIIIAALMYCKVYD